MTKFDNGLCSKSSWIQRSEYNVLRRGLWTELNLSCNTYSLHLHLTIILKNLSYFCIQKNELDFWDFSNFPAKNSLLKTIFSWKGNGGKGHKLNPSKVKQMNLKHNFWLLWFPENFIFKNCYKDKWEKILICKIKFIRGKKHMRPEIGFIIYPIIYTLKNTIF